MVPDLRIAVLDIMADEDRVIVNLALEGTDRRADRRIDAEGAFGVTPPIGLTFRVETAMMFRLSKGKIVEDWLLYNSTRQYGKPLGRD